MHTFLSRFCSFLPQKMNPPQGSHFFCFSIAGWKNSAPLEYSAFLRKQLNFQKKNQCLKVKCFLIRFLCWIQIWNQNLKICFVFFLIGLFKFECHIMSLLCIYVLLCYYFYVKKLILNKKVFLVNSIKIDS